MKQDRLVLIIKLTVSNITLYEYLSHSTFWKFEQYERVHKEIIE